MVLENNNLPNIATMPLMSIGVTGGECLQMQNGQNCEVIAVGQQ